MVHPSTSSSNTLASRGRMGTALDSKSSRLLACPIPLNPSAAELGFAFFRRGIVTGVFMNVSLTLSTR